MAKMVSEVREDNGGEIKRMTDRIYNIFIGALCLNKVQEFLTPVRIIKSGPATIVFWADGEKTVVKLGEGDQADDYAAFCAALGKRLYGSNSALKKMLKEAEVIVQK